MARLRGVHYSTANELEIGNFHRTLAEIEWLLLTLILVYLIVPESISTDKFAIIAACGAFSAFVLVFRYLNLLTQSARWKLMAEAWVMIALIAFVTFHSGGMYSPLLSLFLLVIIFSALTLGKAATMFAVAAITAFYLYLAGRELGMALYSYEVFSTIMVRFAPYLLVAYVTSLLAADMIDTREMMRQLSETDELTGALNMRAFSARLQQSVETRERDGGGLVVMMIDADRLKTINDEHGHEEGNRLIRVVLRGIRNGLRNSDIVARYGGDEFVALLDRADEDVARAAGERVRAAIEDTGFNVDGERIIATVSIGFSVYPDTARSSEELLEQADEALYAGKQAGRNRVLSFSDTRARVGP